MELLKKLISFFDRRERVVVSHLLRDGLRVYRCVIREKKVSCELFMRTTESLPELSAVFRQVRRASQGGWRIFSPKFVVVSDPGFAASIYGSVAIPRDRPEESIRDTDVENVIAQGIWKMFDRERARAAGKMGFSEVDLMLSDVSVREVRLDDHRVVDPRGFTAKTVAVELLQTLVPRPIMDAFAAELPAARRALFIEGGVVTAHALFKSSKNNAHIFIQIFSAVSDVFVVRGSSISYADTVPWGAKDFVRAIADAFSVSPRIAEEIVRRVLSGKVSAHFRRQSEKIMAAACEDFALRLGKTVQHYGAPAAYLLPFYRFGERGSDFPDVIFNGNFRTRAGTRIRFKRALCASEGDASSYGEGYADHSASPWDFSTYAALDHFFFSSPDDTLNKVARRHARWLSDTLQKRAEQPQE